MFCPKCGKEETGSATFCRGCGERLASRVESPQQPSEAVRMGVQCPKCRNQVDGNLAFCPHCGESMRQGVTRATSWAWWLLPIFFTWIGGIAAWQAVKDRNKKKATWLMILGFIMLGLWLIFWFLVGIAGG